MKLWAFDTETFLIQPGLAAPALVCGSWGDSVSEWIGDPAQTVAFFVSALERGDHLVGINLAFDLIVLAAHDPTLLPLIFKAGNAGQLHDCAVAEGLHDIAISRLFLDYKTGKSFAKRDPETGEMSGRYSMAILMQRHFNVDISAEKTGDVWRYKYASLAGVPLKDWPKAAIDYPLSDARRTFDIWQKQQSHKNRHDEPAQTRAAIALMLMRTWGFRTDGVYIAELEQEVDRIWNEARAEFAKAGIFRPDGTKDTKRLQEMVTAAYDGEPPRTEKGAVSTDRDTLEESGVEILVKLGTAGKNDKRKTQYIPALKEGIDRPISPEFNAMVNTGRISSDWQQLPKEGGIREAIVSRGYLHYLQTGRFLPPDQDNVIGSLDYGGLELRTMSERAILDKEIRFSKMADMLNAGKDVHAYVGAYFLGKTLEDVMPLVKSGDPFFAGVRAAGKEFNFSAAGGSGAATLAYGAKKKGLRFCLLLNRATKCGEEKDWFKAQGKNVRLCVVCVQTAKDLKEKWLKAWPEQGMLFEKAAQLTNGDRKVDAVIFGSRRVRGGCSYTQWLNTPFQGAGGDGCKAAMWRVSERAYTDRRSALWGTRAFLNVHDELLFEFPWDRRHEAAFEAAKIMVDTMNEITPHVKNDVVPAIMRRVFKSAKDVYDRSGKIRPYWPSSHSLPIDSEVMAMDLAM